MAVNSLQTLDKAVTHACNIVITTTLWREDYHYWFIPWLDGLTLLCRDDNSNIWSSECLLHFTLSCTSHTGDTHTHTHTVREAWWFHSVASFFTHSHKLLLPLFIVSPLGGDYQLPPCNATHPTHQLTSTQS